MMKPGGCTFLRFVDSLDFYVRIKFPCAGVPRFELAIRLLTFSCSALTNSSLVIGLSKATAVFYFLFVEGAE